jgi:hypothetical protein
MSNHFFACILEPEMTNLFSLKPPAYDCFQSPSLHCRRSIHFTITVQRPDLSSCAARDCFARHSAPTPTLHLSLVLPIISRDTTNMARKSKSAASPCLCSPVPSPIPKQKSQTIRYDKQTQEFATKRHRSRKRKRKSKLCPPNHNGGLDDPKVQKEDAALPLQKKQKRGNNKTNIPTSPQEPLRLETSLMPPLSVDVRSHPHVVTLQPTSPLLRDPISTSLPSVYKKAVSALGLFQSRTACLQSNITLLETRLQIAREEVRLLLPDNSLLPQIFETIKTYEEIFALALEHLTHVTIHEHAFRDVFDETSSAEEDFLAEYGNREVEVFWAMKRAYDERLFPLLQRLSPVVMAFTAEQMVSFRINTVARCSTSNKL